MFITVGCSLNYRCTMCLTLNPSKGFRYKAVLRLRQLLEEVVRSSDDRDQDCGTCRTRGFYACGLCMCSVTDKEDRCDADDVQDDSIG